MVAEDVNSQRQQLERVKRLIDRTGIHQLTEEEIHNVWTIPRMRAYALILGVPREVSPWQADGMVTVKLAAP